MKYDIIVISILFYLALLLIPIIVLFIAALIHKIFWKQTFGTVTGYCKVSKDITRVHDDTSYTENVIQNKAFIICEIGSEVENLQTKFSYSDFWFNRFYPKGKKVRIAYKNNGKFKYFIYSELMAIFCSALPFILATFAGYLLLILLASI